MYSDADPSDLTLRDHLARDRTILANERTLLSYLRTAFGLAAGGGTLMKLFPDDLALRGLGIGLLVIAILVACVGAGRFIVVNQRMRRILQPPNQTS